MLDRWLRWMRGRLSGEIESLEDPELLLQQAQEEMRAMHAKNRERAVQAITQKNNLQQMVNDTQKTIERLHAKANAAKLRGDADKVLQFFGEIRDYEELLLRTEQQLEYAIMTSEAVKAAIKREEEKIIQMAAEALALKAQWKVLEVERSLTRFQAELNSGRPVIRTHEQITDRHARNERLATEAIAAKNSLLKMVNDTTRTVENLRDKAGTARKRGDGDLEHQLLREMEQYEASLAGAQEALSRAEAIAERAKTAIQEEENWLQRLSVAPPATRREGTPAPLSDDEADVPNWILLALTFLFLLLVALVIWILR